MPHESRLKTTDMEQQVGSTAQEVLVEIGAFVTTLVHSIKLVKGKLSLETGNLLGCKISGGKG